MSWFWWAGATLSLQWWLLLSWSPAQGLMGFSSCCAWAQELQLIGSRTQAQWLWHPGLVALWHVRSSQTGDWTHVSCTGRQTSPLSHQGSPELSFDTCVGGASLMAQWERICLPVQERWVLSLGWEDSSREGNGNPLQFSCLGNPRDRGAWRAIVHSLVKELDPT